MAQIKRRWILKHIDKTLKARLRGRHEANLGRPTATTLGPCSWSGNLDESYLHLLLRFKIPFTQFSTMALVFQKGEIVIPTFSYKMPDCIQHLRDTIGIYCHRLPVSYTRLKVPVTDIGLNMTLEWILFIAYFLWSVRQISATTSVAECTVEASRFQCEEQNLTAIPSSIPKRNTILQISLKRNNIKRIKNGDLANLTNLQDLYVSYNELSVLEPGCFDDLTNLQYCDLSYNLLTTIPADLFRENKYMKFIHLTHNSLKSIPSTLFQGLERIIVINLAYNLITTLDYGTFDSVKSFYQIWLHENPFKCDCNIQYFVDWMKTVHRFKHVGFDIVVCRDNGIRLQDLPDDYFEHCKEMDNGEQCDDQWTMCKSTSVCLDGMCTCKAGFYDDNGNKTGGTCLEELKANNLLVISVTSASGFVVLMGALFIFLAIRGFNRRSKKIRKARRKKERVERVIQSIAAVKGTTSNIYQSLENVSSSKRRPLDITEFLRKMAMDTREMDDIFAEDWKKLVSVTENYPSNDAVSDENKAKNRDLECVPYDMNRVKLEKVPRGSNDYINASYISGRLSPIDYIAAQVPMQETMAEFWQMIWEQDIDIVVDITCDIDGLEKSTRYWAEEKDGVMKFGQYLVETRVTVNASVAVVYQLKVSYKKETRTVTLCKRLNWETDDELKLINLVQLVWKNQTEKDDNVSTKLVVDRTGSEHSGVFITLDMLLQDLMNQTAMGGIDIFNLVLRLRNERPKLIEKESQYKFIHECVRSYVEARAKKMEKEKQEDAIYRDYLEF